MGEKNNHEDRIYDPVLIRFSKGQKVLVKAAAERQGKSLNAFVVEAVREKMEREGL